MMQNAPETSLIAIEGLTHTFGTTTAIQQLDLHLQGGQIVGLLGENGSGKTTLLKILAGVLRDYTGQVSIVGHAPGPVSKAKVSFLPDSSFLPNSARVTYCLEAYQDFFEDFNRDKAEDLIAFFGLEKSSKLREMSKGMREKLQISLAMSRDAKVFLLDEPISGVDPAARQLILKGILRNLADDSLLFISTHLVHDLEPILDAVVMMRHGSVTLTGTTKDLRQHHGSDLETIFREAFS